MAFSAIGPQIESVYFCQTFFFLISWISILKNEKEFHDSQKLGPELEASLSVLV